MTIFFVFLACIICGATNAQNSRAGNFDYYKLALTYVSAFCADPSNDTMNSHMCTSTNQNVFKVHGFWPQNEHGWPQDCFVYERSLSNRYMKNNRDLIPDKRSMRYQWRKHGSCSGLNPSDYFTLMRKAYNSIDMREAAKALNQNPQLSENEFRSILASSNPSLKQDDFSVHCSGKEITEIRACMTKDLKFRSCSLPIEKNCRSANRL